MKLNEKKNSFPFIFKKKLKSNKNNKVRIVQKKDDKKLYALKYINKEKCVKMKAVQNVIQERQLLEQIKHPFIVNLQFAFQDDENMFMYCLFESLLFIY